MTHDSALELNIIREFWNVKLSTCLRPCWSQRGHYARSELTLLVLVVLQFELQQPCIERIIRKEC